MVGFLLDLELRRRSAGRARSTDLMRLLLQRHGEAPGLPERGVEQAALELVPERERAGLQAFFERSLRSTAELELGPALAGVGLAAVLHGATASDDKGSAESDLAEAPATGPSGRAQLGASLRERNGLLEMTQVAEGSAAQLAGLAAGDEIAAVDGFRSETRQRLSPPSPASARAWRSSASTSCSSCRWSSARARRHRHLGSARRRDPRRAGAAEGLARRALAGVSRVEIDEAAAWR